MAGLATALAEAWPASTCSARSLYGPGPTGMVQRLATAAEFFSTMALLLGPAFVHMLGPRVARVGAAGFGGRCRGTVDRTSGKVSLAFAIGDLSELRSSSLLLAGRLRGLFVMRLLILIAAGIVIPTSGAFPLAHAGAHSRRRWGASCSGAILFFCRRRAEKHRGRIHFRLTEGGMKSNELETRSSGSITSRKIINSRAAGNPPAIHPRKRFPDRWISTTCGYCSVGLRHRGWRERRGRAVSFPGSRLASGESWEALPQRLVGALHHRGGKSG